MPLDINTIQFHRECDGKWYIYRKVWKQLITSGLLSITDTIQSVLNDLVTLIKATGKCDCIQNETVCILICADDIVLITENERDLQ